MIKYIKQDPNNGNLITIESTKSGAHYTLVFNPDTQEWRCNCPHSVYRRIKNCKHIKAFLDGALEVT